MSPRNIVRKAKEVGLHLIAITDHNMTENSLYVHQLGEKMGLFVLFGMELQTMEEIHVLVLFDNYEVALLFQKKIYCLLPDVANDTDYFGDQVVVNEEDEIVRFEEKLLLNSAQISITDAVMWVKNHGGLCIPSHIDSPNFSIIAQLGYVPEDLPCDALEVRNMDHVSDIVDLVLCKLPFVTFSDAHYLDDVGKRRTFLDLEQPTCADISAALRKKIDTRFHDGVRP